jgi:hypothetical protein
MPPAGGHSGFDPPVIPQLSLPGSDDRLPPAKIKSVAPPFAGGHSGFDLLDPPQQMAEPMAPTTSAELGLPQAVCWWEHDLCQSVLPDRQALPMTHDDALAHALQEAPELKILHADWYIRMQEEYRRAAAFDWTTFLDSVWNRDSNPVGSQLDGAADRLRSRTSSAAAGIRRLDRAGGRLAVRPGCLGK